MTASRRDYPVPDSELVSAAAQQLCKHQPNLAAAVQVYQQELQQAAAASLSIRDDRTEMLEAEIVYQRSRIALLIADNDALRAHLASVQISLGTAALAFVDPEAVPCARVHTMPSQALRPPKADTVGMFW